MRVGQERHQYNPSKLALDLFPGTDDRDRVMPNSTCDELEETADAEEGDSLLAGRLATLGINAE